MKRLFSLFLACIVVSAAMAWDALYIVGGGTKQAGWDGERIPMEKISETEFEYSGYFYKTNVNNDISQNQGFKIVSSGDENDWGCTQYRPADDWAKCERGTEVNVSDGDIADNKFWIETAGFYTINIKTDVNKVTISSSDKPKYLFPVGNGCEVGWNTRSDVRLTETEEGSGKYTGKLTLTPASGHELKFLCQRLYTAHVGPLNDADGAHDISGIGNFADTVYTSGDHKFWILDQAAETYNLTVDIVNKKIYFVPENITIKVQATKEVVAALGTMKCFTWTGVGSETKEMSLNDGFYYATFSTYMPLNFLIYNGKFNNEDGGVQSVDMTNDGNGYYADKCVNLISRRDNNKLMCFHNDDCSLNTNSFTVNIYAEAADWEDVWFFTQNAGDQNEYQNVFTHAQKGDDNWYSYTFEKTGALRWVATATTENWNTQVDDIDNIDSDKYFYVSTDKHDNGHNKIIELPGKGLTTKINADGFASVYMPYDFTLPEGVNAYKGSLSSSDVTLTKVNQEVLPKKTGLILYSATTKDETITLSPSTGAEAISDNAFTGHLEEEELSNVYVLAHQDGQSTAFYYISTAFTLPAYRAYLQAPAGAPLRICFAEHVATGLDNATEPAATKIMKNGRVLIVRGGNIYNVMGQIEK